MGQAEGEYRGDTDVILNAAITKIPDADFAAFLAKAEVAGICDASKYANKMELINDLPNLDETAKEAAADELRAGRVPF